MIAWISSFYKTTPPILENSERGCPFQDIPFDVIFSIFQFLSLQDVARAAAVCKRFRHVAHSDYLPFKLRIPKIKPETVQSNVNLLWESIDLNLDVNEGGLLYVVPWQRIGSAAYEGQKNAIQEKVCQTIAQTLIEVCLMNLGRGIKNSANGKLRHVYVWKWNHDKYDYFFPAHFLAEKLINPNPSKLACHQFKDHPDILRVAKSLIKQKGLYQDLRAARPPYRKQVRDIYKPIVESIFNK